MTISETSTRYAIQWRAFVGPPFRKDTDADFWDWSGLSVGEAYEPVPADTTLVADLEPGETTLAGIAAASWPAAGGAWIGANAAGEATEYVGHAGFITDAANELTGLIREAVDAEQTGHHTVGAPVRFWSPLTTNNGEYTLTEHLDDKLSSLGWQAALAGFNVPQAALRNRHLVLVEIRTAEGAGGDWGAWTVAGLGWLRDPGAKDSWEHEGEWSVTLEGLNGPLATLPVKGLRVGPQSSSFGGNASGSQELTAANKEQFTGELVSGSPDVSPSAAIDGDYATPYVTEKYLGTPNIPSQIGLNTLRVAAYPGQGPGYRWLKIQLTADSNWTIYYMTTQTGRQITIANYPGGELNGKKCILLLENELKFEAENPGARSTDGYTHREVSTSNGWKLSAGSGTVEDWWNDMAPGAGRLTVSCKRGPQWIGLDDIAWGTGGWLPASQADQYIRRLYAHDRHSPAGWAVDNVCIPGDYPLGAQTPLYWMLETAGMGLNLTDPITATSPGPGQTLRISVGNASATNGLDPSGTLQFGVEQVTYSAKVPGGVTVLQRAANGTEAAPHPAGDKVSVVEGGVAVDAWPITAVVISRPVGRPVPKNFRLYGARWSTQPPAPSENTIHHGWEADWDLLATVVDNASATYTYPHAGPVRRYKWLTIVVDSMSVDPYRLMLNEVRALIDGSCFDEGTYLATGTVFQAARALLRSCGIFDGAILDGGGTPTVVDYTTAPGMALAVLSDLMDMTGCMMTVGRDSKVMIRLHPNYGIAGAPAEEGIEWTNTVLSGYRPDWKNGRSIGQVQLEWVSLDGTSHGTVKYPAVPDSFGDVSHLGPLRFANEAAALVGAEKRYWASRILSGATMELVGAPWTARPGMVKGARWPLDPSMLPMDRTYLLDSADHRIGGGKLTSVVHGAQLGRNDER